MKGWFHQPDGFSCGVYTFMSFLYFMDNRRMIAIMYPEDKSFGKLVAAHECTTIHGVRQMMMALQCCYHEERLDGGAELNEWGIYRKYFDNQNAMAKGMGHCMEWDDDAGLGNGGSSDLEGYNDVGWQERSYRK